VRAHLTRSGVAGNETAGAFPSDTYGQSLQCITISAATADLIAGNLMIDRTYIYSSANSSSLAPSLPSMSAWLGNHYSSTQSSVTELQSLAGDLFYQFAKSGSWGKDLWDDLVAPYFKSALSVETWRNGSGGRMSSICGTGPKASEVYDVYEVASVVMPDGTTWAGTQDHSKWGAALEGQSATASCVGDINRMCSQEARGGGALCSTDERRWAAFSSIIKAEEACYQYNPCYPSGTSTQCYWCPTSMPTTAPAAKEVASAASAASLYRTEEEAFIRRQPM